MVRSPTVIRIYSTHQVGQESIPEAWALHVQCFLLLTLLLFSGSGLADASSSAVSTQDDPIVIMISLDGVRPLDLQKPGLSTLERLMREGASAEHMTPVFPSNTFPNHVSLVTGVLPEAHGIVSNVFKDPVRGKFSYDNDPTWLEAEPLWSFLARAELPSAAYHWVGSEGLWTNGLGATHWKPYKSGIAEQKKIDQILVWLDLPASQVPRLMTIWFRGADSSGHRKGPDSSQVVASLQAQDRALAQLVAGIEQRALWPRVTLLIVSDHGMAEVKTNVDVGKHLKQAGVQATLRGGGGFTIIEVVEPQRARVETVVRELGMELIWRPGVPRTPIDNARFGSGVIVAPTGTAITRGYSVRGKMKGAHGYWPEAPEMRAVFVAFGRNVSPGQRLGIISNLDVMPTILQLLELDVPSSLQGRALFSGALAPQEK